MRNADERLEKMKPILGRIPVEWGRYLPDAGWDDMLLELDSKLSAIDPDYIIFQAKQKFGGLRYYTGHDENFDGDTEAFEDLVHSAENASYTVCEYCGGKGKTRRGGWIRTLCDEHAEPDNRRV